MQSSLSASIYALDGAGKSALLEVLPEALSIPEQLCLCLVDAERLEESAQKNLLAQVLAHARAQRLYPVFVLTRADRVPMLRPAMARLAKRLAELGCDRPEIYPVSAEAAQAFLLPTKGRELSEAEQSALARFYDRFGPGESCLAGYAQTGALCCVVGGREVSPTQLRAALENTGVPALIARLEELSADGCPEAPAAPAETAAEAPAAAPVPASAPASAPVAASEPENVTGGAASAENPPAQPDEPTAETAPAGDFGAVNQEEWFARIAAASLDTLPEVDAAVRALPVDEAASAELRAAVNRRRWDLQCEEMDRLVSGCENMDCANLLTLAQTVRDSDFPDAIREKTLSFLHEQFQNRELTELRELTLDCEAMELPELTALKEQIEQGPYALQSRAPYVDLINHQMDSLHVKAMEEFCEGLEEADAGQLAEMRGFVDDYDCADVLKSDLYRRMELRQDELDRQALDALTAGAELKSVEELAQLEQKLIEGTWNPKLINAYRHRVALCREAAIAEALREETAELDSMDRSAVLALRERILGLKLPDRLCAGLLQRIDERIYRLDALRLATMENDFDALGFDALDGLRARIAREDVCERSKVEYLEKLSQREHALIYENAASHASLAQQVATQFKLRLADFDFSLNADDFDGKLKKFWGGTGLEQPRDIPVFLLDSASTLAFSNTRFWYKNGRDLAFLPLEEIERFQVMKQLLSANLQIVRKDSTYLLTDAKLFRGNMNQILSFLNECLRRWPEHSLPEGRTTHPIRTPAFRIEALAAPTAAPELTENAVLELLRARCAAEKLKAGTLAGTDEAAWQAKLTKLLQTFGLPEQTKIAWYDTSGILGAMKDGIAVGPAGVYLLNGKQDYRLIPTAEIYSLSRVGRRAVLTTLQNQTENLDLPLDLVPVLGEYLKGIQLARFKTE